MISHFIRIIQIKGVFSNASPEDQEEMIRDMLESMDCIVDEVYINVDKLTEGLAAFGYVQQETRPKSKKNLEYRRLGFKAIRIMNRLAQTVYKHGI